MNDNVPNDQLNDEGEKLFAELAMPGERQIILLGLIVAVLGFFGPTLWEFIIG